MNENKKYLVSTFLVAGSFLFGISQKADLGPKKLEEQLAAALESLAHTAARCGMSSMKETKF